MLLAGMMAPRNMGPDLVDMTVSTLSGANMILASSVLSEVALDLIEPA